MQNNIIQPPTEVCNKNFQELLDKFHSLVQKNAKKDAFDELKIETLTKVLTGHQIAAIIERCNNLANGTYGSSSKELNTGYYAKK